MNVIVKPLALTKKDVIKFLFLYIPLFILAIIIASNLGFILPQIIDKLGY